jgi:hypothetical protein
MAAAFLRAPRQNRQKNCHPDGCTRDRHRAVGDRSGSRREVSTILRVSSALKAMRKNGCALHLEHRPNERWWLSSGREVPTKVARAVIQHPDVIVGGCLFGWTGAQTYRHRKGEKQ